MSLLFYDQTKEKNVCVAMLKALPKEPSDSQIDLFLSAFRRSISSFNVRQDQLMKIIEMQLKWHNKQGAIKVIEQCIPARRLRAVPLAVLKILIFPITAAASVVKFIVKYVF